MRCFVWVAVGFAVAGCDLRDKPVAVTGRVMFDGKPVTEGVVQFLDLKTNKATDGYLGSDGRYQVSVLPGRYTVLVFPPTVADHTYGLPSPQFKAVANIPAKYRMAPTSGLVAEVAADQAAHDFDLKP